MTIKQRGDHWWYDIHINGKRERGSCKTTIEKQAQEYHDQLQAGMWKTQVTGEKVRRTWAETVAVWLKDHDKKKSIKDDWRQEAWWSDQFKSRGIVYLDQITPAAVKEIRDAEVGRPHSKVKNVTRVISEPTVNRKLAFLRSVINAAHREYQWLDSRPLFKGFPENNHRLRFLEPHEFVRLVQHLPEPFNVMAVVAVATGLRRANVTGMRWDQVNMQRRSVTFEHKRMKNGKPFTVALNDTALGAIRKQVGKHGEYVFPRADGQRIREIPSKTWKKAIEAAGIEDFHWHDLRHTWASWLRQDGKGLDMIQELGGWSSAEMVKRYAHQSVEHLREAAGTIDRLLMPQESGPTQIRHSQ